MKVQVCIESAETRISWQDCSRLLKMYWRQPGVYVLYGQTDNVLYVGMSDNLGRRVREHWRGNTQVPTTKVKYCVLHFTGNKADADILETYLINILRPEYNIAKAVYEDFVRSAQDLAYEKEVRFAELFDEIVDICTQIRDNLTGDTSDYFAELGDELALIRELREREAEVVRVLNDLHRLRRRGGNSLTYDAGDEEAKVARLRRLYRLFDKVYMNPDREDWSGSNE